MNQHRLYDPNDPSTFPSALGRPYGQKLTHQTKALPGNDTAPFENYHGAAGRYTGIAEI